MWHPRFCVRWFSTGILALGVAAAIGAPSAGLRAAAAAEAAQKPAPLESPGLGDPGKLLSISFLDGAATLSGIDGRRQLLIDGKYASGPARDLSAQVSYRAAPPGIVAVDPSGLVVPIGDGEATITATAPGGPTAQTTLRVEGLASPKPIDFTNQIVPIFTKAGCNAGGCHGKMSGQNGFRLSLLGFYPR